MARIARELGVPLMPWQQLVVDVGLELEADGTPAYRKVVFLTPRQQGKTTLNLSVETHRAIAWPRLPQRISYSAQTGWDGHKKLLDDQVPLLQGSALWEVVARVFRAAGADGVLFTTGSRIDVMASGAAAGHGRVIDLGIVDEAFDDVDDHREQAMVPAMMTRDDAQLWVTSTAGHEGSVYLKREVEAGRGAVVDGLTSGTAYFEWSADPDAPIDDPATWYSCMPALGITVTERVVHDQLQKALAKGEEGLFRRAFLNQWTHAEERVIPKASWDAICGDAKPDGGLVFGIDASLDRSAASIVTMDSQQRGELVDYREGVAWLEQRVPELAQKWNAQVAADTRGPVASVLPALESAGVGLCKYSSAEMSAACARLFDGVVDRKLSVRRDERLDLAVASARKRFSSDSWFWGRSTTQTDVSPLVALTLAFDLSLSSARQTQPWAYWG